MAWQQEFLGWLAHTAVGGSLFLLAACAAVLACRQPVQRIRLIELTLVGCLLLPWAGQLPGLPQWSLGWLALNAPAPERSADRVEPDAARFDHWTRFDPVTPDAAGSEATSRRAESPRRAALETVARVPAVPATPSPTLAWSLPAFIIAAYVFVATLLLARLLAGLGYLAWLRWTAHAAPQLAVALFRQIAGPAGHRVRLLASESIELPLTFPGWRPIILLPQSLCRGDTAALRYGLAHEWSHVERGDIWRWYLATLAQFLFFYQPLFWWLRRQLRRCQDYLADARAAGQAAETEDYAEYLVALARRRLGVPAAALSIGDRHSNLYRRIAMLVQSRQPLAQRCLKIWSLVVSLAALGVLVACSALRLDAAAPPADDKAPAAKETAKEPNKAKPAEKGETLHYSGRVTDKDTNKPIAGAIITVRRSLLGDPELKQYNPMMEESKHTTNAEGKYNFTIPPEQSSKRYLYIELDVEHTDYAPQKGFGYALSMIRKNEKLGGRPFFEHVQLRPGKAVVGIVQTPEGKPAAGIKVLGYSRTTRAGNNFEYGSFDTAKTDEKGRFRLVMTTPGEAIFWILPKEHALSAHKLKDDQRGEVGTIRLRNGIAFKGQVLDAKGKPLAGVSVNVERENVPEDERVNMVADSIGRATRTNEKGEFTMGPLPPGDYRLYPAEHHRDPTDFAHDRSRRPLSGVFVRQKLVLKEGEQPGPLEMRAVPHVVIEAQHYDGKGKKTRGHAFHIFGQIDGGPYFTQGKQDADGKVTALVPHGLEQTQLNVMTNEHGVLRWRRGKGEPLNTSRTINLGTVNDDVKDIEIIRYVAPILVINALNKDKRQIKGFQVQALYAPVERLVPQGGIIVNGVKGDVHFEKQEDGRWRSSQLLPGEELTVTVTAEGYAPSSIKLKPLSEGETKDLELVLEKATGKKEDSAEKKQGKQ